MSTLRQNKVARLIQRELAEILQKEGKHYCRGTMVTVTLVRMSPDLSVAKVYLSIFAPKGKEEILDGFRNHMHEMRRFLGSRIGRQVRIIPELIFYIDDSLDYAEHIGQLLKK